MPLQAFSFPIPETRFFQVGQYVYKFKIKGGSKIREKNKLGVASPGMVFDTKKPGLRICNVDEMMDNEFVSEELENAVRVVIMSLGNLHPFATQHFNIFPYKSRWERVSELTFRKGDKKLFAYPFLITLYVETNKSIPPRTVNHENKWVFSDRESGLDTPPHPNFCAEHKRRRAEEPQEGPLSSDHHYGKVDAHLCLQELPNLSEGAKEMVCDKAVSADSEESSEFDVVEQDAPDLESKQKEKPGVFARLASIAVFPFSLFFRRS